MALTASSVCVIKPRPDVDGQPCEMHCWHLSRHRLSPDDHRARYRFKPHYPMESETYTLTRSDPA